MNGDGRREVVWMKKIKMKINGEGNIGNGGLAF
jgi:hypothetical protein